MSTGDPKFRSLGEESQDSNEPAPPGTARTDFVRAIVKPPTIPLPAGSPNVALTSKGVENAKKRLRAFSIQKKNALPPITPVKPISTGTTTVFIGKLTAVKTTPKPPPQEDPELKKKPRPPKPGAKAHEYMELKKKTLSEIEDMKRKMELVDLGIPLGLIYPTSTSEKAMPTKAMPPIKSFLDPAKLDEIIKEAKKAKAEGKEFKFDYSKLLPGYDNPFQRKKDEPDSEKKQDAHETSEYKDKRKSDTYDSRSNRDHRKDDRYRGKRDRDDRGTHRDDRKSREDKNREEKNRDKDEKSRDKNKHRDSKNTDKNQRIDKYSNIKKERNNSKPDRTNKESKETDVNLNDYLVCDSWSLDNDDKTNSSSPKPESSQDKRSTQKEAPVTPKEVVVTPKETFIDPIEQLKQSLSKPVNSPSIKMEKLKPVTDTFEFDIDPNEVDNAIDIFDENSSLEKYGKTTKKPRDPFDSPVMLKGFDYDLSKDDDITDDTFLESVINEIKEEDMTDNESQDSNQKGIVEYDASPGSPKERESVTPEMDDRIKELHSSRSNYSDGYRSSESGYKSTESGYRSTDSAYKSDRAYKSPDRSPDRSSMDKEYPKILRETAESLETWSFVLKICQPLLFRHDRNKCYRETLTPPKLWYSANARRCGCVADRAVVYDELEMCKMTLVDRVYGCDQIPDAAPSSCREWYPRTGATPPRTPPPSEWEADDSQPPPNDLKLDREYQRFMQAVWPEVAEVNPETPETSPIRQESRKKKAVADRDSEEKKKTKKMKLSSEGWSQESDIEEEPDSKTSKALKSKDKSRKRKLSSSSLSFSEDDSKKRKTKKKEIKKAKEKVKKRLSRKYLRKLKEKQKKKKSREIDDSEESDEDGKEKKKKQKMKKKKQQKKKKKLLKKKKAKAKSSSSSSSSSESSSDSEDQRKRRKKEKRKRKKKHSSSSSSSELFDVNILNNMKTERVTDDERREYSPRPPREIIDVKELQTDFVGNVHIKQEIEEEKIASPPPAATVPSAPSLLDETSTSTDASTSDVRHIDTPTSEVGQVNTSTSDVGHIDASTSDVAYIDVPTSDVPTSDVGYVKASTSDVGYVDAFSSDVGYVDTSESVTLTECSEIMLPSAGGANMIVEIKEPLVAHACTSIPLPEESPVSQESSQESSVKEPPPYEKDDSHLRPSSQNSNYSFHDVIQSETGLYAKGIEDKFEGYEGNYEMYEQLAMAYQSDVAKQKCPAVLAGGASRIETVVGARSRGEIKCDWRAGDVHVPAPHRPSRWGLKPGEVNIVLTGGPDAEPEKKRAPAPVYRIQSLANRTDTSNSGYDEAYRDMYAAADRLQYGDCFAERREPDPGPGTSPGPGPNPGPGPGPNPGPGPGSSLDERISLALRNTVLGEVAKEAEEVTEKDAPEKGILVTKSLSAMRLSKRVSFADGYTPGQDSDVEQPPARKSRRRLGCAWPCPATHVDHVPLWDALPPPPPPPGDPPAFLRPAPAHLNSPLAGFMPPEPPPGLISFA